MAEPTQSAPSPNSLQAIQSPEARAGMPTGMEPGQGYKLGKPPGHAGLGPAGDDPLRSKVGILVSFLLHALAVVLLGMTALLAPKRPSTVPVFELVSLEKPKLRPLTPKTVKPPEPPPPEPEPVKPPEAPKLTPKPEKAVVTKKPEPKVVKEPDPDPRPVKEVVQEQQVLPQVVAHVPADPRLSQWAARVKKKAETLWKPPTGLDILGPVKTIVTFSVTRDGIIQDPGVSTGSGNADLDELALRTIQRMEHVPPIPENYPEDLIQVSYEFIYSNAQ